MALNDLLKIGLPSILGIVAAIVTYRLGRRAKIDDRKIQKGMELAEEISKLFQDIVDLEEYFYEFYKANYSHLELRDAVDNFTRMKSLFYEDYKRIDERAEKRSQLYGKLKIGRVYLNSRLIERIRDYLNVGEFHYEHDAGGLTNTYYEDFFKNIIDKSNIKQRQKLKDKILPKLKSLFK